MNGVIGIVAGIALFILALAWVWHGTLRHESGIKYWWSRVIRQAWIGTLRRRFKAPRAFARARLSPGGYFGLQMTAGALVLIGASWLLGGISEDVLTGDPLTLVDRWVAAWFHAQTSPLVTRWMLMISNLHGVMAVTVYATVFALYLLWKRDWYWPLWRKGSPGCHCV